MPTETPAATPAPAGAPRTLDALCLCAAWCRLCEGYRAVFDALAAEPAPPGIALRWRWIDIEDEADLLGDLDIETFPTWVIAEGATLLFAGTLTPEAGTVRRILAACLGGRAMPASAAVQHDAVQAVVARVRAARPGR